MSDRTFQNESPLDFSIASHRDDFNGAVGLVRKRIEQREYVAKPIVEGRRRDCSEQISSLDPAAPSRIVGTVHLADTHLAQEALDSLATGARIFNEMGYEKRAHCLLRLGDLMARRRNELAALMIYEAGKPWKEADADVCEAIDFCRYYAIEMLKLGPPRQLMQVTGETNYYFYRPRGLGVVIAPWNFPLAIPCGMTVASLVTGNPTILKPAEQTSVIASEFAALVLEAGVPPNAFAFLPALGESVGKFLVESPQVHVICFTGSRDVGLQILRAGATVPAGQNHVKRVITEMGGKNAAIIDEDADLDEAVKGVLYSAFGFAGQKCSACSRVIAVGDSYEPFLSRLCDATGDLLVGHPEDPATFLNPLIDQTSQERVLREIADARGVHTLAFQGEVPSEGFYVPATIFRDVETRSRLWQEELFAPVLACRQASNFLEAIEMANNTQYALTGGVFSRSPKNIEYAYQHFEAGNLYINRSTTGAIVCRQPFGGYRLSGIGSKAGGPDYLLQFVDPRTVTENSMRRGFTPELV
ncbi:MAG: aldehyde dehydrogenase family protein [Bdellovibrionales bacterium]|nr:aldehyde dehydrogenase family protein [Bdellovibrionales bacterium]